MEDGVREDGVERWVVQVSAVTSATRRSTWRVRRAGRAITSGRGVDADDRRAGVGDLGGQMAVPQPTSRIPLARWGEESIMSAARVKTYAWAAS